ncbi:MAG: hypothetical protein KF726_10775 [Anaerolineae bacterium]|nr:hypothetical protein [Anaerolineae bacterium]
MTIFDIFIPWIALAIVVFFLMKVQRFILRHLFGVGFLIGRGRGPATLIFYLVLLPGIILHEISRYLVAGMFRVVPTHITFTPEEQADGTFDLGFVQFGFIINPVYRAIIDLVPLAVGIFAVIVIGGAALGWPDFIASLRTLDIYTISEAFQKLVSKPDFVLWSYILFGVVNTMMPTRKEAIGLWLPIAVLVAFLGIFAIFGIWTAVTRLMLGPVATIIYGLTAVFGVVLFLDTLAAIILWTIERLVMAITRKEVQYAAPAPKAAKPQKIRPKTVFELQLPLPAPPGKPGFKARGIATTLPVPAAEMRPAASTTPDDRDRPTVERPQRPALEAPAATAAASKPETEPVARPATPAAPSLPAGTTPLRPAATTGSASAPAPTPAPSPTAPKPAAASPFARPAEPARTTGTSAATPATPPRLNPPAVSSGSGSNLPAPAAPRSPSPPPLKSPVPTSPKPSPQSAPKLKDDDVIEGEVVDEDEDDSELKYAPLDD